MREILIPLGLVALGLLLIGCEFFVPSAGILGILATTALIAGVTMAFYYGGIVVGTVFMLVTLLVVGSVVYQVFRWWPHTKIGKSILIEPNREVILVDRTEFQGLVGRVGKALGTMMPGGYVEIDGKRYDGVAEVAVEDGDWITVTGLSAGRTLKVRSISEEVAIQVLNRHQSSVDPLSQPARHVVDDPFRES